MRISNKEIQVNIVETLCENHIIRVKNSVYQQKNYTTHFADSWPILAGWPGNHGDNDPGQCLGVSEDEEVSDCTDEVQGQADGSHGRNSQWY